MHRTSCQIGLLKEMRVHARETHIQKTSMQSQFLVIWHNHGKSDEDLIFTTRSPLMINMCEMDGCGVYHGIGRRTKEEERRRAWNDVVINALLSTTRWWIRRMMAKLTRRDSIKIKLYFNVLRYRARFDFPGREKESIYPWESFLLGWYFGCFLNGGLQCVKTWCECYCTVILNFKINDALLKHMSIYVLHPSTFPFSMPPYYAWYTFLYDRSWSQSDEIRRWVISRLLYHLMS